MNRTGNGNSPVANDPGELERRHFEATRELLELRAKLRSRVGVPSGQAGHLRKQAQALEAQLELIELTIGGVRVEQLSAQKVQSDPPRSRAFLQSFYQAAKGQLPPELVARFEAAAAKDKGE